MYSDNYRNNPFYTLVDDQEFVDQHAVPGAVVDIKYNGNPARIVDGLLFVYKRVPGYEYDPAFTVKRWNEKYRKFYGKDMTDP